MTALFTVGHSTRSIEDFTSLLLENEVKMLVDVRSMPYSRYCPQFGREALAESLLNVGIQYSHLPSLGGLRKKVLNPSPNMAWRNASFRNYADYMQTPEFEAGIEELKALVSESLCVIMCSEAVPWKCHRSLISDAMIAREYLVEDIINKGKRSLHKLTSFAKVSGTNVTYPLVEPVQLSLLEGMS